MTPVTLTKIGNSKAVLLPKTLRQEAQIDDDTQLSVSSPRKGVVVITAIQYDTKNRLDLLDEAEAEISANAKKMKPWVEGETADDAIKEALDAKAEKYLSL